MLFALVFVVACALSLGLTPLVMRIAQRYGFMDVPGHPKHVHKRPTPRLGGISLYLAFLVAVALSLPYPRDDLQELTRLLGLVLGATIVVIMGVYDDRYDIPAAFQLAVLLVAAAIAVIFGIRADAVTNPFGGPIFFSPPVAVVFTLLWLWGMMITANTLDGLDGLAAGVTIIASLVLFVHTYRLGQHSIALLPLALAGCALGFLPFNFHPARIFMGSSGVYFLGFSLGVLSIIGGAKVATALLVMGIPILDVASIIIARLRAGYSPLHADRRHLHHRLYDRGLSQQRVVLLYYFLCAFFGSLALVLSSRIYKLYALMALGALALVVVIAAARDADKR